VLLWGISVSRRDIPDGATLSLSSVEQERT
jgi:hypothetical protein